MTVRERNGTMAYLGPLTTSSGQAAVVWLKARPALELVAQSAARTTER